MSQNLFVPEISGVSNATLQPYLAMLGGNTGLEAVGELTEALANTPSYELAVEHLKQDPRSAALIEERYMSPPHDLEALLRLPPETLGHVYASTMKAKGFRAEDLYEGMSIDSEIGYVETRLRQTHDIWHIITGFGASVEEEIGLQAFYLPQFPYPLAVALLSSSMMSSLLTNPEELPVLLESIRCGWEMGRRAELLFGQKWEEAWEKPLARWREELNVIPLAR